MRVIRCTNCNAPLPGTASYCGICGENLTALQCSESPSSTDRPPSLKVPYFYAPGIEENGISKRDTQPVPAKPVELRSSSNSGSAVSTQLNSLRTPLPQEQVNSSLLWDETEIDLGHNGGSHAYSGYNSNGDNGGNGESRRTWQKIVSAQFPRISSTPVTPVTPRPTPTPTPAKLVKAELPKRSPLLRISPPLFFWVVTLLLTGVAGGALFGMVTSLGHPVLGQSPANQSELSLQVTPTSVAINAMITLRGSNFSPNGKIGLTRDANIPILDTGSKSIVQANSRGAFADTVIVDPDWRAGSHIIRAEDALRHRIASFTILVTGTSASLRPAHLSLLLNGQPSNELDLGSGDQATNSTQVITLTNAGGGQISWQTTATQPWLLMSPKSGTFSSGQNVNVTVAVDRSNLKEGNYTAQLIFSSSAGQVPLPVKMKVTPLEPGHQAVLQLTPAVLSFTATDGDANPTGQVITVSNPGALSLDWSASVSPDTSWLSIDTQAGTVAKGGSSVVKVSVGISTLLPGTYTGFVAFTAQGPNPVKNSPQNVFVSLTITPQCMLSVAPGALAFTGVYLQRAPAPKVISLTEPQGCTPLRWTASTQTKWLSVGATSGVTPANLTVGVNISGLSPGVYNGSALFTSSSGTQTLPVSLTIGQPATPILTTAPAGMTFAGVVGQPAPPGQLATITNGGGGSLAWTATAATTVGGAWLAVTPSRGNLASKQAVSLNVTASVLAGLIPGTYTGTITIAGKDGAGNAVAGSPQTIAVTFVVQPPCTIAATPVALTFAGVAGQSNPAAQNATIKATGTCKHTLNWAATVATTPAGGTWLKATPASGTVNLSTASATSAGIVLTGLAAGTYTGSVTIRATDSVTGQAVGTPQVIRVTLTVQPPCTLQTPSATSETFSAEAGTNPTPAAQTFTVGIVGACAGKVTITPTVTLGSGTGWLAVTPASAKVSSGKTVTFAVKVKSAALPAGTYTGSISLTAVDKGIAITGSPQTVAITLNVVAPPTLSVSPTSPTFNVTAGTSSQPVTISNTGGEALNWTAVLAGDAPGFISLSASSGNDVAGGASASFNVIVDATGISGGSTFTTSVTVGAIDPITGNAAAGSPATVSVTINVAAPAMRLDRVTLSFTTTAGTNPSSQSINIMNTGGGTLEWTPGTPDQSWLTVSFTSNSDIAGQTSQLTFTVDVTSMTAGTYTANVTVTPASGGMAQTITATLTIN